MIVLDINCCITKPQNVVAWNNNKSYPHSFCGSRFRHGSVGGSDSEFPMSLQSDSICGLFRRCGVLFQGISLTRQGSLSSCWEEASLAPMHLSTLFLWAHDMAVGFPQNKWSRRDPLWMLDQRECVHAGLCVCVWMNICVILIFKSLIVTLLPHSIHLN